MLVRMYETLFITRVDVDAEVAEKIHQRLVKSLEALGGAEIKLVDWGKRKLAYEIARQKKGNYWYFGYIADPQFVKECERQLRISNDVIRYQTVCLSKLKQLTDFDVEAERKRAESLTPEREEDEEDQYLRRSDERRPRRGDHDDDDDVGEEGV
ncbi:MAG: 30S ribosomal protein S6 [Myxococcales bacterium]|nr:30S ribosomal protein S6 [Myxococcales bacterium]